MRNHEPSPCSICCDCLQFIANGEEPHDNPDNWSPPDGLWTLGWTREECEAYGNGAEDPEWDGDLGFSWTGCEACNSNLGGDRHAATLWLPLRAYYNTESAELVLQSYKPEGKGWRTVPKFVQIQTHDDQSCNCIVPYPARGNNEIDTVSDFEILEQYNDSDRQLDCLFQ